MKKLILIIILIIVVGIVGAMVSALKGGSIVRIPECPDEMIINKMPGTAPKTSYYITGGVRHELTEYDESWLAAHCHVPVQEAY